MHNNIYPVSERGSVSTRPPRVGMASLGSRCDVPGHERGTPNVHTGNSADLPPLPDDDGMVVNVDEYVTSLPTSSRSHCAPSPCAQVRRRGQFVPARF